MTPDRDSVSTERTLGRVLTVGTWVSTSCLAAGLLLERLIAGAIPGVLLHSGIIALMATPGLRVAVSVGAFARRGEWWLVLCATVVLVLLVVSLLAA